jgi:NADPH:quinone reductase-like Zn-dependent oxidoreductase
MKARAAMFDAIGDASVLQVRDVDVPEPAANEMRIRVHAFGLNRSEAMFRQGWHPLKPVLPSRIGYECAGIVESVGAGVMQFAPGDAVSTLPVMALNVCGAYGELLTVPSQYVVANPPELSMEEAASLWSSYLTAYVALVELASIKQGDFVLVTAASSSVGPAAIQILNMLGARPIAVTSKRVKAQAIRNLGAHHVIVTEDEDLVARVGEITGGIGAQLVFDPVGGPMVAKLAEATALYGAIILYGVLDFAAAPLPVQLLIERNLTMHGFAMYLDDRPERNARAIAFVREGVSKGKLRPLVGKRFALESVAEASAYLDSMQQIGKVVVSVTHPTRMEK